MIDAFTKKYGVKASTIRLSSSQIMQRFASEAAAGTFAAEVLFFAGGAVSYAEAGIAKGWIQSIAEANLPVLKSGEFPARFNRKLTAVVQVTPYGIGYNTEKAKGADIPKAWTDLLNPKWKGQVLVSDPKVSEAYVMFWSTLADRYGASFFEKLRPNLRSMAGGIQAAQSVAAGEGAFVVPAIYATTNGIKQRGAPIDLQLLPYTSGVDMQVVLTARDKVKHPNAARLLANYVMSAEGNKVFNDEPGGFTIYERGRLPAEYQEERPGIAARTAEVSKLLGF